MVYLLHGHVILMELTSLDSLHLNSKLLAVRAETIQRNHDSMISVHLGLIIFNTILASLQVDTLFKNCV